LVSAPTGRCSLGRTATASTGTPLVGSCGGSQRAGIDKPISPHSMRHAAISAALDAGCSLRDVQDFARHAGLRQTRRYDRARGALDRNPTYIVATYLAGATGAR
jgi:integrase